MAKRRKRGSVTGILLIIIIVVVIASVALLAFMVITGNGVNSNPVTQTVNREITKKAVDTVIQKETGTDITLDEIKGQMSEEDAKEVDSIVNEYADQGLLAEALEIYNENGGDIKATADRLKDRVSEKDMERLYELYAKYGNDITP